MCRDAWLGVLGSLWMHGPIMRPWIFVAFSAPSTECCQHGSLVTSSLLAETFGDASLNSGYVLGQEDETYSISAAHGYFGRLIFQFASFS